MYVIYVDDNDVVKISELMRCDTDSYLNDANVVLTIYPKREDMDIKSFKLEYVPGSNGTYCTNIPHHYFSDEKQHFAGLDVVTELGKLHVDTILCKRK
jgi:hypothetical protein